MSRRASWSARRAFSLIELLTTVVIIAILASMLMVVLGHLRRQQRTAATLTIMDQIGVAVNTYLQDAPVLGELSGPRPTWQADPWEYLYKSWKALGKVPLLDCGVNQLAEGTPPRRATSQNSATFLCDAFPAQGGSGVLRWTIFNETNASGRTYTALIRLWSEAGTPAERTDDIILELDVVNGGTWQRVTYAQAKAHAKYPEP